MRNWGGGGERERVNAWVHYLRLVVWVYVDDLRFLGTPLFQLFEPESFGLAWMVSL